MNKSLILDAVLVIFLLLSAFHGKRMGFVRSLFSFVRQIIAFIGAVFMADTLSPLVSLIFLIDGVSEKLSKSAQSLTTNIFTTVSDGTGAVGAKAAEAASGLSKLAQKAGLPKFFAESVAQKFSAVTPKSGETLLSAASKVVSDNIAYIVVFLLSFVIILIITGFFTNWIVGLIRFILPRSVDGFFGFIFGAVSGCLLVVFFFEFARGELPALFVSGAWLSPGVVNNTFLVSRLANFDISPYLSGILSQEVK
ncbi:MAG: CvpA family protein [Bacillota bacterium]|nr:CvpA family protein [Bacillota bacterium]